MHGSVIQYFLLHVYHSQSISRDMTGHYLLGTNIISQYLSIQHYQQKAKRQFDMDNQAWNLVWKR